MPVEQVVAPALHPLRHQILGLIEQERHDRLLFEQQPLDFGEHLGAPPQIRLARRHPHQPVAGRIRSTRLVRRVIQNEDL